MLIDISHKKREIAFEAAQVVVKIVGFGAKIEVTQLFANRGTHPVEAKFTYPVPKDGTLCGYKRLVKLYYLP
jgi:ABC-type xylose transport system substrate-binding protein